MPGCALSLQQLLKGFNFSLTTQYLQPFSPARECWGKRHNLLSQLCQMIWLEQHSFLRGCRVFIKGETKAWDCPERTVHMSRSVSNMTLLTSNNCIFQPVPFGESNYVCPGNVTFERQPGSTGSFILTVWELVWVCLHGHDFTCLADCLSHS